MPRHMEQPACRHSAPASLKTTSRPSSSAASRTRTDPGTTSIRTPSATRRPRITSAAARRSSIRPFVHDPRNTVSTRDVAHRGAGRQPHVVQGLLGGGAHVRVCIGLRVGNHTAQRHALRGVGAPRHERCDLCRVEDDLPVELRVVVGDHRAPVGDRSLPVLALRSPGPAVKVVERRLVGGHHACPGAGLDRHVADRHPGFHRQGPDRRAAVLDHVTLAATRPDLGDDRQDHVLRGDARGELALDRHRHRPERLQRAASGSRGRARPRWCRCRTRAHRRRRAWRCGSRHRRPSCPAESARAAGRRRGRCPARRHRGCAT